MASIGRIELLLTLVGLDAEGHLNGAINGITRLQKFLFLLEREGRIVPAGDGFQFKPYKAGPYSPGLYDDLELLENLGLIESKVAAEATEDESNTIDQLSFDDLMGGFAEPSADSFEERRFTLTRQGRERVERILADEDFAPVVDGIKKVKTKFCYSSLRDILRYVYKAYPDMTTESEIRDQILD